MKDLKYSWTSYRRTLPKLSNSGKKFKWDVLNLTKRETGDSLSHIHTPHIPKTGSKVLQPLYPLTCSPAPNASVQPTQMCELSWETAALCVGWRWRWPHWWAWWSGSLQRSKEWLHQLAQSRHNQPAFLAICTHLPGHPNAASNRHIESPTPTRCI